MVLPVIDYGSFAERLAARTDRWGLLIEFQREWGYIGDINTGFAAPEDDEDEDDFEDDEEYCPIVPEALTEWYALPENSFMEACRLYWTHPHDPVTRWPTEELLRVAAESGTPGERITARRGVFMAEYEYCWTWSYLEQDAAENPDPPVYIAGTETMTDEFEEMLDDASKLGEYRTARSVSEWALAFAVTHVPFAIKHGVGRGEMEKQLIDRAVVDQHAHSEEYSLTDEQRARIRENFPELGLLPWYDFGCYELRGGPDVIILLRKQMPADYLYWEGDFEFRIAARTQQALAEALKRSGLAD